MEKMNNYWVGVIVGGLIGTVFSLIALISYVDRINNLTTEVEKLRVEVADHERIMSAYEFYNWNATLKMYTEDLE